MKRNQQNEITLAQAMAVVSKHYKAFVFAGYHDDCLTQTKIVKTPDTQLCRELGDLAEDALDAIALHDDEVSEMAERLEEIESMDFEQTVAHIAELQERLKALGVQ